MVKPVILEESNYDQSAITSWINTLKIWEINDVLEIQLRELFELNNPQLLDNKNYSEKLEEYVNDGLNKGGTWVYYPWSGVLVHTVREWEYYELRTNRNKNLINRIEQLKLHDFVVAIVGLSMGANIASTLTYQGIANTMKLADYDKLSTTNLNRLPANLPKVGQRKTSIIAENIYNINPFAKLLLMENGLRSDTDVKEMLISSPKPGIIIDAIDDFAMKVRIRQIAREEKIPILMLTNVGDNVIIDIERYDKHTPVLFNGLAGDIESVMRKDQLSLEEKNKYAVQIVGRSNVPQRAIESLKEIGKTLIGRPQLISTISISAGIASKLIKCIALGEDLKSGRTVLKIAELLTSV